MSGYLDWSPRVLPVFCFSYGIHPSCSPVVVLVYQIGKMAEVTGLEHMQGFIVCLLRLFAHVGNLFSKNVLECVFILFIYFFYWCFQFNLFFLHAYVLFCFCVYIYEYIPKWFALDMSALIGLFFPSSASTVNVK